MLGPIYKNWQRIIALLLVIIFSFEQVAYADALDYISSRLKSLTITASGTYDKAKSAYKAYKKVSSVTGLSLGGISSPLNNINTKSIKFTAATVTTALTRNPQAGINVYNASWTKAVSQELSGIQNKVSNANIGEWKGLNYKPPEHKPVRPIDYNSLSQREKDEAWSFAITLGIGGPAIEGVGSILQMGVRKYAPSVITRIGSLTEMFSGTGTSRNPIISLNSGLDSGWVRSKLSDSLRWMSRRIGSNADDAIRASRNVPIQRFYPQGRVTTAIDTSRLSSRILPHPTQIAFRQGGWQAVRAGLTLPESIVTTRISSNAGTWLAQSAIRVAEYEIGLYGFRKSGLEDKLIPQPYRPAVDTTLDYVVPFFITPGRAGAVNELTTAFFSKKGQKIFAKTGKDYLSARLSNLKNYASYGSIKSALKTVPSNLTLQSIKQTAYNAGKTWVKEAKEGYANLAGEGKRWIPVKMAQQGTHVARDLAVFSAGMAVGSGALNKVGVKRLDIPFTSIGVDTLEFKDRISALNTISEYAAGGAISGLVFGGAMSAAGPAIGPVVSRTPYLGRFMRWYDDKYGNKLFETAGLEKKLAGKSFLSKQAVSFINKFNRMQNFAVEEFWVFREPFAGAVFKPFPLPQGASEYLEESITDYGKRGPGVNFGLDMLKRLRKAKSEHGFGDKLRGEFNYITGALGDLPQDISRGVGGIADTFSGVRSPLSVASAAPVSGSAPSTSPVSATTPLPSSLRPATVPGGEAISKNRITSPSAYTNPVGIAKAPYAPSVSRTPAGKNNPPNPLRFVSAVTALTAIGLVTSMPGSGKSATPPYRVPMIELNNPPKANQKKSFQVVNFEDELKETAKKMQNYEAAKSRIFHQIKQINKLVKWGEQTEEDLMKEQKHISFLAKDSFKDEIVGYANMYLFHDRGYISRLATRPDWQGNGVATKIFHNAVEEAQLRGLGEIQLEFENDPKSKIDLHKFYNNLTPQFNPTFEQEGGKTTKVTYHILKTPETVPTPIGTAGQKEGVSELYKDIPEQFSRMPAASWEVHENLVEGLYKSREFVSKDLVEKLRNDSGIDKISKQFSVNPVDIKFSLLNFGPDAAAGLLEVKRRNPEVDFASLPTVLRGVTAYGDEENKLLEAITSIDRAIKLKDKYPVPFFAQEQANKEKILNLQNLAFALKQHRNSGHIESVLRWAGGHCEFVKEVNASLSDLLTIGRDSDFVYDFSHVIKKVSNGNIFVVDIGKSHPGNGGTGKVLLGIRPYGFGVNKNILNKFKHASIYGPIIAFIRFSLVKGADGRIIFYIDNIQSDLMGINHNNPKKGVITYYTSMHSKANFVRYALPKIEDALKELNRGKAYGISEIKIINFDTLINTRSGGIGAIVNNPKVKNLYDAIPSGIGYEPELDVTKLILSWFNGRGFEGGFWKRTITGPQLDKPITSPESSSGQMKALGLWKPLDEDIGTDLKKLLDDWKQLPVLERFAANGKDVTVVSADLGNVGADHFEPKESKGKLIIVVNSDTSEKIQEEGIFHEVREDYWMSKGFTFTQHEAHIIASAQQVQEYSNAGNLTSYHHWQINEKLSAEQLEAIIREDESSRQEHHTVLERANAQGANVDIDAIKKYETILRQKAKEVKETKDAKSFGLCLTPDSLIHLADGTKKPLIEIKEGDEVLSLNQATGELEPHKVNVLLDMGVRPVYKLTTQSGKQLKTTLNHPYLTKQGWKKLKDIQAGEEIVVADRELLAEEGKQDSGKHADLTDPENEHPFNKVGACSFTRRNNLSFSHFDFSFYLRNPSFKSFFSNLQSNFFRFLNSSIYNCYQSFSALFSESFVKNLRNGDNDRHIVCSPLVDFGFNSGEAFVNIDGELEFVANGDNLSFQSINPLSNAIDPLIEPFSNIINLFIQPSDFNFNHRHFGFDLLQLRDNHFLDNLFKIYRAHKILLSLPSIRDDDYFVKPNFFQPARDYIRLESEASLSWDKIISIEPIGKTQVYDIEVEGTHNFVAEGILAHNTYVSQETEGRKENTEPVKENPDKKVDKAKVTADELKDNLPEEFSRMAATGIEQFILQNNGNKNKLDPEEITKSSGAVVDNENTSKQLVITNKQTNQKIEISIADAEALAIAQKGPDDNPHYLLRAAQRELFKEKDVDLTQEIKKKQEPKADSIDKTRKNEDVAQNALRGLPVHKIDGRDYFINDEAAQKYLNHLEGATNIFDRKRGLGAYGDIFNEVEKIAKDIIKALADETGWDPSQFQVHLIEDYVPNAYVYPFTGHIMINIGILSLLKQRGHLTKDAVGALIGHEIIHNVQAFNLLHAGKISRKEILEQENFINPKSILSGYTNEYDADIHSLRLLSRAGYNPLYGLQLWEDLRFYVMMRQGSDRITFSHPSTLRRIEQLRNQFETGYVGNTTLKPQFFSKNSVNEIEIHSHNLKISDKAFQATTAEEVISLIHETNDIRELVSVLMLARISGENAEVMKLLAQESLTRVLQLAQGDYLKEMMYISLLNNAFDVLDAVEYREQRTFDRRESASVLRDVLREKIAQVLITVKTLQEFKRFALLFSSLISEYESSWRIQSSYFEQMHMREDEHLDDSKKRYELAQKRFQGFLSIKGYPTMGSANNPNQTLADMRTVISRVFAELPHDVLKASSWQEFLSLVEVVPIQVECKDVLEPIFYERAKTITEDEFKLFLKRLSVLYNGGAKSFMKDELPRQIIRIRPDLINVLIQFLQAPTSSERELRDVKSNILYSILFYSETSDIRFPFCENLATLASDPNELVEKVLDKFSQYDLLIKSKIIQRLMEHTFYSPSEALQMSERSAQILSVTPEGKEHRDIWDYRFDTTRFLLELMSNQRVFADDTVSWDDETTSLDIDMGSWNTLINDDLNNRIRRLLKEKGLNLLFDVAELPFNARLYLFSKLLCVRYFNSEFEIVDGEGYARGENIQKNVLANLKTEEKIKALRIFNRLRRATVSEETEPIDYAISYIDLLLSLGIPKDNMPFDISGIVVESRSDALLPFWHYRQLSELGYGDKEILYNSAWALRYRFTDKIEFQRAWMLHSTLKDLVAPLLKSGKTFEELVEKITEIIAPSVFRNYLLMELWDESFLSGRIGESGLPVLSARDRDAARLIAPYLIHDSSLARFNSEKMAGAVGWALTSWSTFAEGAKAKYESEKAGYGSILFHTPGSAEAQMDVFLGALAKDYILSVIDSDALFEHKLGVITDYFAHVSSARDEYLVRLLEEAKTIGRLLQLRELFSSQYWKDKAGLMALELDRQSNIDRFQDFDYALSRILHYFPEPGLLRDDLLGQLLLDYRVSTVEYVIKVNDLMLKASDNLTKDKTQRYFVGSDVFNALIQNLKLKQKAELLLWLMAVREEKPEFLQRYEYIVKANFDQIKEMFFAVPEGHFKNAGKSGREQFLQQFFDIDKGIVSSKESRVEFIREICENVGIDTNESSVLWTIIRTAFELDSERFVESEQYRSIQKRIILNIANQWVELGKIKTMDRNKKQVRFIQILLESGGLVGVKVGQFFSQSNLVASDPELREGLTSLKERAEPINIGTALLIISALCRAHNRILLEIFGLRGRASIKNVYEAVEKGDTFEKRFAVKLKRPGIQIHLVNEMAFAEALAKELQSKGILPKQVSEEMLREIKKMFNEELDFEKEAKNQRLLSSNTGDKIRVWVGKVIDNLFGASSRKVRIPNSAEVYENQMMVEDYAEGFSLGQIRLWKNLYEKGYSYNGVKNAIERNDSNELKKISKEIGLLDLAELEALFIKAQEMLAKHNSPVTQLEYLTRSYVSICRDTAAELMKQFFIDGFFHLDPHEGNILVSLDANIIHLIDCGAVGNSPLKERIDLLVKLAVARIFNRNAGYEKIMHNIKNPQSLKFFGTIEYLFNAFRVNEIPEIPGGNSGDTLLNSEGNTSQTGAIGKGSSLREAGTIAATKLNADMRMLVRTKIDEMKPKVAAAKLTPEERNNADQVIERLEQYFARSDGIAAFTAIVKGSEDYLLAFASSEPARIVLMNEFFTGLSDYLDEALFHEGYAVVFGEADYQAHQDIYNGIQRKIFGQENPLKGVLRKYIDAKIPGALPTKGSQRTDSGAGGREDTNFEGTRMNLIADRLGIPLAQMSSWEKANPEKAKLIQDRLDEIRERDDKREIFFNSVASKYVIVDKNNPEFTHLYSETEEIVKRLLEASGFDPDNFNFYLLDSSEENAFILRYSNKIFVNIGLIKFIVENGGSKDALAFVLAHEIRHISQWVDDVIAGKPIERGISGLIGAHADEYDADYALSLIDKAGYSVRDAGFFFTKFIEKKGEVRSILGFLTHPPTVERLRKIERDVLRFFWLNYFNKSEYFSEITGQELNKRTRQRIFQYNALLPYPSFEGIRPLRNEAATPEEYIFLLYKQARNFSLTTDIQKEIKDYFLNRFAADDQAKYRAYEVVIDVVINDLIMREKRRSAFVDLTLPVEIKKKLESMSPKDLIELFSIPFIPPLMNYTVDRISGLYKEDDRPDFNYVNLMHVLSDGLSERLKKLFDADKVNIEEIIKIMKIFKRRHLEYTEYGGLWGRSVSQDVNDFLGDLISMSLQLMTKNPDKTKDAEYLKIIISYFNEFEKIRMRHGESVRFITDLCRYLKTTDQSAKQFIVDNWILRGERDSELKRQFFDDMTFYPEFYDVLPWMGNSAESDMDVLFSGPYSQFMRGYVLANWIKVLSDRYQLSRQDSIKLYEQAMKKLSLLPFFDESELSYKELFELIGDGVGGPYYERGKEKRIKLEGIYERIDELEDIPKNIHPEIKRLIYFYGLGGILGIKDTFGHGLSSVLAWDQGPRYPKEDIEIFYQYLLSKKNAIKQRYPDKTEKTELEKEMRWARYILPLALYLSFDEKALNLEEHSRGFRRFIGEFYPLTDYAAYNSRDEYEKTKVERGRGINRVFLTGEKIEALLNVYGYIINSNKDFEGLFNEILKAIPATTYRNFALYILFVEKFLKPQYSAGIDINQMFNLGYMQDIIQKLNLQERTQALETLSRVTSFMVRDKQMEQLNEPINEPKFRDAEDDLSNGEKQIIRAGHSSGERGYYPYEYTELGGSLSQLDIFAGLLAENHIFEILKPKDRNFKERLDVVLKYFTRESNTRDHFISLLIEDNIDTVTSSDIEKTLPLLNNKNFKERYTILTLEKKRNENPEEFSTLDGELKWVLYYFPKLSPTRDDILLQVIDEKANTPDGMKKIRPHLLKAPENVREREQARAVFGISVFEEYMKHKNASDKMEFLLWVTGISDKKPFFVIRFEYEYNVSLNGVRDTFMRRDSGHYKKTGDTAMEEFLEDAFLGENGIFYDEKVTQEFLSILFNTIMPAQKNNVMRVLYDAVFKKADMHRKYAIVSALLKNFSREKGATEGVNEEARAIRIFLESLGLIGVKIGQFLSTYETVSGDIRNELKLLKDKAPPLGKDIVFDMLAKIYGSFEESPISEILASAGRASIKVVYKARLKDGREIVVKIKRPEVEKKVEEDLAFFHAVLSDPEVVNMLRDNNIEIPRQLENRIAQMIQEEMNFQQEVKNQDRLRGNIEPSSFRKRLVNTMFNYIVSKKIFKTPQKKYVFRAPVTYDVQNNTLIIEELANGIKLSLVEKYDEYLNERLKGKDKQEFERELKELPSDKLESLNKSQKELEGIQVAVAKELIRQIFIGGFYHADPHAGNIFVDNEANENVLYFIDVGSASQISVRNRYILFKLISALQSGDKNKAVSVINKITGKDMPELSQAAGGIAASQENVVKKIIRVFKLLEDSHIGVDAELISIFRCFGQGESLFKAALLSGK